MDIQKLDIKKKLAAGTALAVLSGFVPTVIDKAQAGTATMPISVQIVTAVNLTGTSALDFGRLAITGNMAGNTHVLSPLGATTTAAAASVVVTGTPGAFTVTAGTSANNIQVSYPAAVTYNAGNISLNRITLAGNAFAASITVAASATATGNFQGGGNSNALVGGRLAFVATPAVGTYNVTSADIVIIDIP